ncbi:glycerol-3-phosphate 1-O-acyltransferase PlsY [Azorhizobium doebereinerae]|uniref:glycerol-3-phosphate 1-O-acyltransferase PlsY n=1 Tax=Azorhizobium doebereinerae TaxID=281091 RepID=UPI0004090492|nr:glycerol-3-phosphate 1-O-acyltransferase PlsY [Azorhizobium doebereinerae]
MPASSVLVWQLPLGLTLAALALGYLAGSIPFGILITRLAGTTDIRTIGSGNIGATNVLRTGRKDLAAATLLGDALKGTVAVLLAGWLWGPDAALAAGLGAFLGHLLPVWLKFNGGKGVATFLGISLGLFWPSTLVFAVTWLGMAYLFRYSSLAALTAAVTTPLAAALLGQPRVGVLMALLALLLWAKHHANIARLVSGTETKIGAKG